MPEMNRIWALRNTYTDALDRPAYEAACAAEGTAPLGDSEIAGMTYALTYGDWTMSHVPTDQAVSMELARRRLRGIEAERVAPPQPARPSTLRICCDCGHSVPALLVMNTSRGTACPDCYDRMSD